MVENETQVETSQPTPGLLEALKDLLAVAEVPEAHILNARAAIAEEEQKRTFTAVFHSATGRMPTEAELQRGVIDSETTIAKPDHAARLREAAPRLWHIVASLVTRTGVGSGFNTRAVAVDINILQQADELFDELKPTEDEDSA